ncbi:hypothetical protein AgCh_017626 [Apium graveolens]
MPSFHSHVLCINCWLKSLGFLLTISLERSLVVSDSFLLGVSSFRRNLEQCKDFSAIQLKNLWWLIS